MKKIVRFLLFLIKRKSYKIKIYMPALEFNSIRKEIAKEYFFGYYDKSPERNGWILFQEKQKDKKFIKIIIKNMLSGKEIIIAEVASFNWQMGARALWINDDIISYNNFDGSKYICCWYSIKNRKLIRIFNIALQDANIENEYIIGVNYQRLYSYAKEYGYHCLPEMTDKELKDYKHDGLWFVNTSNGDIRLLISIEKLLKFETEKQFVQGKHFVNHVMINPSGNAFIFIHRYYIKKSRHDRLMYYDFKELRCILKDRIQSHYCWLDDNIIFGYGEYKVKCAFHSINVITKEVICHPELDAIHPKDGHPTVHGEWIAIDSYPDLSRMQSIIIYNIKTKKISLIGEFYHDLKHKKYDRCDLHPRYSADGKRIYIDTIYSGKRELCSLELKI